MTGSAGVAVFIGILFLMIAIVGNAGSMAAAFVAPGEVTLNH